MGFTKPDCSLAGSAPSSGVPSAGAAADGGEEEERGGTHRRCGDELAVDTHVMPWVIDCEYTIVLNLDEDINARVLDISVVHM